MGLTKSPEPNSMANVAASIAKRFCVSIDGRLASTSSELSAIQSCLQRTEGEIQRLLKDPDASPLQVAASLCHEQARVIGRPHVQARDGCVNELHSSLLVFLLHHAKVFFLGKDFVQRTIFDGDLKFFMLQDDLLNEARLEETNYIKSKQATQFDTNTVRDPRDDTYFKVTRFCNRLALTWQECSTVRTSVEQYGDGVPFTAQMNFERPVPTSPVVVASPVQPFQQCPATRHSILSAMDIPTSDNLRTQQTSQLGLYNNSVIWPAILLVLIVFAILVRKGFNFSKRPRAFKIIDMPAFRELVDVASAYRHASEQYTWQDKVRPYAKLSSTAHSTVESSLGVLSLESHQAFQVIVSRWRFKRMLRSARRIQASWRKSLSRNGRLQGSEGICERAQISRGACEAAASMGDAEENSASEFVTNSPEDLFEIEDSERLEEQLNMSSATEYYSNTNSLLDILPSGLPGRQGTHKRLFAMRQQMAIRPVQHFKYSEVVDTPQQQFHLLPPFLQSCSTTLAVSEMKKRTREVHCDESSHTSASQPEVHMPLMCSTINQTLDEVPLAGMGHSSQGPTVVLPKETGIPVEDNSDTPSRSFVAPSDRGTSRLFLSRHSTEVFGADPCNSVAMDFIGGSNMYARQHDYASHTDRAQHSAAWTIYKFVTKRLVKEDASETSKGAHASGDSSAQAVTTTRASKATKQIVAAARIKSFLLNCKSRQRQGTLMDARTSTQSLQESQNVLSAPSCPGSADAPCIDLHEGAQQRENMRGSFHDEVIRAQNPSYGLDLGQSHQQRKLDTVENHQTCLSVVPMRSKIAASRIQQCWRRHHKRTLECYEEACHFAQPLDDMHGILEPWMSNEVHVKLEKKAEQLLSRVMYTAFLRWRYRRVRDATIFIQRVWRNYRRRPTTKRRENAAISIQKSWQHHVMSSQDLDGKHTIDPNRIIRNNEVPRTSSRLCPSDMIGRKSVTPQSIHGAHAFRALLFRWRFQRVRSAVRRIQRAWRSSRKNRCKSPNANLEVPAVTVGTPHIQESSCGQGHHRIAWFSRQMWKEVVFIVSQKLAHDRLQEQSAAMCLQRFWKQYRKAKDKPKRVKLYGHTSSMWWCSGWQEHMQNLHSHLFPSGHLNLLHSSIGQNVRSSECSVTPASDTALICMMKEASRVHAQPQGLTVERPEEDLDDITLVTLEENEPMKGSSEERIVVKSTKRKALLATGSARYIVGDKHTSNDSVMNKSHLSSSLQTAAATLIQRAWRELVCLDNQEREVLADERVKAQRIFYLLKNVHGAAKQVGDKGNRKVIGMKSYQGPELHHTNSKVPNLLVKRPATLTVCHLTSREPTFTVDAEDNEYEEPILDVQKRIAWF